MMTELSLNLLDVAENGVRAGATLIRIGIDTDTEKDRLIMTISDNGCGMSEEQVRAVTDPFFTTRTTRKVGLGVPFFKMAAEITGGSFRIDSVPGKGTDVIAEFVYSSIDRAPLGDVEETMVTLISGSPDIDFVYEYSFNGKSCTLDTREVRQMLEGVPLDTPEVISFLRDYLKENRKAVDSGAVY